MPGRRLARTWWFCTLDWPSPTHDYTSDFERLSLRKVELEDWDNEPNIVSQGDLDISLKEFAQFFVGRSKVFEIPFHRGVFQDAQVLTLRFFS